MADSYRLLALKALTAHLEGITKANGYDFDLDGNVFRGRPLFGQDDPIPMLSILEAPRNDAGQYAGENKRARKENWSLMIQGWAHDDKRNPTDPAYALLDAVENRLFRLTQTDDNSGNALYPDEYLLGNTISGITIYPGVVRPPMENVSSKAFFYLPIEFEIVQR